MGIHQKIYDIMCATESLEKDLVVGTGNNSYKAVGESTVLNMLKPLFKEHKLICIPKDGEIVEKVDTYVDGYGKNKLRAITQLKVFFTLIDIETGEREDIVGFGNGADSQDKGSGKAFTYAFKTALNKSFMMFSGEDSDNDHSDDLNGDDETITTKQLSEMITQAGQTDAKILARYKKETNNTVDDIKFIKQEYKQKYYNGLKESLTK